MEEYSFNITNGGISSTFPVDFLRSSDATSATFLKYPTFQGSWFTAKHEASATPAFLETFSKGIALSGSVAWEACKDFPPERPEGLQTILFLARVGRSESWKGSGEPASQYDLSQKSEWRKTRLRLSQP